jgi:hypothetical protein
VEIPYDEEFTRDWDWYAADSKGLIGHFTSAGFRQLPSSIRADLEATEACLEYFERGAKLRCGYTVSEDLESHVGTFPNPDKRERYLRSFIQMASKGLYSFDTKPLWTGPGFYLLVARPDLPLRLDTLPLSIAEIVRKTRYPLSFENALRIEESETHQWSDMIS